jgi:SAM-dependent methyltransferase
MEGDVMLPTEPASDAFWELMRNGAREEPMASPFGTAMLDRVDLRAGDRVLDVGCGSTTTTLEAATRVLPGGSVTGVDIAGDVLEHARFRATNAGVVNIDFVVADAAVHDLGEGGFDVVISRFGVMFFADPAAAFANLQRSLRPGGRLAIVVPRGPADNELIKVSVAAAAPHLGTPDFDQPDGTGEFAFADGGRLTRVVSAGGFGRIELESVDRSVVVGSDVNDVTGYVLSMPEAQELLAGQTVDRAAAAISSIRQALAPYATQTGIVMTVGAWLLAAVK